MRNIIVSLSLFVIMPIIAQNQFSVELGANYPVVANAVKSQLVAPDYPINAWYTQATKDEFSEKLGLMLRANYSIPLQFLNGLSLSVGGNLSYYRFSRSTTYGMRYNSYTAGNDVVANSYAQAGSFPLQTKVLYMGFPVLVNYQFFNNMFVAFAGFDIDFLLYNSQQTKQYKNIAYNNNVNGYAAQAFQLKDLEIKKGIYKISSSLELGVKYNILSNIFATIRYQRALTPIYESGYQVAGTSYFNILTVGVGYSFF